MKVFAQIAVACLAVQVVFAAKSPIPDPVCDARCPDAFPIAGNRHLPYDDDCTKFCHCANDGNWLKDCPPGLHFNARSQVCDWPASAGCAGGDVPPTIEEKPTEKPEPTPGACAHVACEAADCFAWPNAGDCQAYCACDHGAIHAKACADGLHFNPATGDCDYPANANCQLPTPPPSGCEHVACGERDCFKTNNTLDCNAYCDCDHGNVGVRRCAEGLHFNPVTAACDFPPHAVCEVHVETASAAPSTAPTQTERECDDVCPAVRPVVENSHRYPGDCTKFCHCANDGNWLKDCPPGLHFNAAKQVCDHVDAAHCVEEAT